MTGAGDQACGHEACGDAPVADLLGAIAPGAALAGVVERLLAAGSQPAGGRDERVDDDAATPVVSGLARGETLGLVEGLSRLDPAWIRELVGACARLEAWAGWVQALMAAALERGLAQMENEDSCESSARPARLMSLEQATISAENEIACRLGVSRRRAAAVLRRGQALCDPDLSPAAGLFRAGVIDAAKFSVVEQRLDGVGSQQRQQVQGEVLPQAAHRTHAQLARDLDRALAASDPEGVSRRRRRDVAGRYVSRPRPAGVGTSEMRLLLPTPDAFLLDATLEAVAASARTAGDARTLAQLRADALVSMTLGVIRRSQHEADQDARGSGALSLGDQSAPVVRRCPDGVPLERLLSSLSALVSSTSPWWTPSGVGPVPFPEGLDIRVDVTVPVDVLARYQEASSDQALLADEGTGSVALRVGGGHAPVPAAVAVALAARGTWRRLLTDPVSGVVLDVGRRRYRPPAALADAVRARDVFCAHPGCEVPASRCDLDHVRPWSQGGTTSADNLTLLCQAHHYLKHSPGWSLTRTSEGALVWRTPSGARYRRDPDGTTRLMPLRVGPRQRLQDEKVVPQALARAVTQEVVSRLERGLSGPGSSDLPSLEARGPRPGQRAGAFESHGYPPGLHTLGLAELLDAVVPF
ncbi:HNH endonuclease signature motif containing protein [Actinomyces faecalis]|uniref:HNH endonuclease signature motif containing protein n=1 Tax=Actinomyces faecalis TaxID=2722820 RepID=UPI0015522617|nr:HNH endonuclease signature motif containing protein [Actinomyces faecalis]